MSLPFAPYESLLQRARELALVSGASSLLAWDQETCLPAKALPFRAEQLSYFGGWTHRLFTAKEVGDWIGACEQQGFAPESKAFVNVREWRRQYDRQTKLPTELVEELRRTTSLAREAWMEARSRSDFACFKPHLDKILVLNRRQADYWGYQESRYDALLEEYEPGMRAAELRPLFAELRAAIVALLKPAMDRSAATPENPLAGEYPIAQQQAFNHEVAEALGFDFQAGRIDTTAHPFCSGLGPRDCRLTTRYHERNFAQSLYGILHEAGHGLYELGLNEADYGTPMGSAVSLGIHESQSRLWENHVGRNLSFWRHWHPVACHYFPSLTKVAPEQIAAGVNQVRPSLIRVEADPVTYDLHIILRFEIERRLIDGDLPVAEVPAFWNETFAQMFGMAVPDDAHGCLQDIHWSLGSLGYFPTYTLGNLNAAQLFHAAQSANPGLEGELQAGRYGALLAWLRQNVHLQGQRFRPGELMEFATGETTRTAYHLDYLRQLLFPQAPLSVAAK